MSAPTTPTADLFSSELAPDSTFHQGRPSRFDIAHVLYLLSSSTSPLQRVLPPELALQVLALAEYWQPWIVHRSAHRRVPNYDENLLYLTTPSLPLLSSISVKKVCVSVHSFGRVIPANTWFEAVPVWARWDVNNEFHEGMGNMLESDALVEHDKHSVRVRELSDRHRVLANTARGPEYVHHTRTFDAHARLVRALGQPGAQLGVFVCVGPGWANFVREMSCTMHVVWL